MPPVTDESPVTDEQVVAQLGTLGVPPENIFVIPGDPASEGLIAFWHPEIGVRLLILENDALAKACYRYLLKRGARGFASGDEIWQAAIAEKWSGWDTCDDVVRTRHFSGNA